ncbi:MAG: 16S rRNA (cytidine(1402)-2'-O)-methyltransferase RsmI [Rhodobacteraceae bacterium HLUCCA08]|nr:MAG: 16S rRNA (cytidine(1402)-2'-O)-methyltransferase RsmI [Rhodobacteraceae bacterium HLUCCA08]
MIFRQTELAPGLYLVATPIGNARDITLRALDVLASADLIAAEDTRTARKLMEIHGIPVKGRRFLAYHDHSGAGARNRVVAAVLAGQSVAYLSEAGTPLLADPGYRLVAEMRAAGGAVTALPGASALLAALAVAGLPTDRVHFSGFLPAAQGARRTALAGLADIEATLVLYESPKRVHELLIDLCETHGTERPVAICRELTKKFEEVVQGTAADLRDRFADRPPKGEVVVLIDRAAPRAGDDSAVKAALREALAHMRIRDAADAVAGALGRPRRDVYQLALGLKENGDDGDGD